MCNMLCTSHIVASNMSSIVYLVPISAFSQKLLPLNLHPIDVSTVQIYSGAVSKRSIVHLHDFTYYYNVCLPLAYVD